MFCRSDSSILSYETKIYQQLLIIRCNLVPDYIRDSWKFSWTSLRHHEDEDHVDLVVAENSLQRMDNIETLALHEHEFLQKNRESKFIIWPTLFWLATKHWHSKSTNHNSRCLNWPTFFVQKALHICIFTWIIGWLLMLFVLKLVCYLVSQNTNVGQEVFCWMIRRQGAWFVGRGWIWSLKADLNVLQD